MLLVSGDISNDEPGQYEEDGNALLRAVSNQSGQVHIIDLPGMTDEDQQSGEQPKQVQKDRQILVQGAPSRRKALQKKRVGLVVQKCGRKL